MTQIVPKMETEPDRTLIDRVVADHHALRRETTELMVIAEHYRVVDVSSRQKLVHRVTRLCECLREHFDLEEEGGYLVELLTRRPGLRPRAARLLQQHEGFLDESAELLDALLGSAPPRDLGARIVHMLEALRRHEQAEHELIQRAFVEDVGSGD